MGYRDDGNNSTRKRRETKQESVVTGYGGTGGTGVDLCQWCLLLIPTMMLMLMTT
jgi:hypothetical protein